MASWGWRQGSPVRLAHTGHSRQPPAPRCSQSSPKAPASRAQREMDWARSLWSLPASSMPSMSKLSSSWPTVW